MFSKSIGFDEDQAEFFQVVEEMVNVVREDLSLVRVSPIDIEIAKLLRARSSRTRYTRVYASVDPVDRHIKHEC